MYLARKLLELPILLTLLTAGFTAATHGFVWIMPQRSEPEKIVEADQSNELTARMALANRCGTCHRSGRSGIDFVEDRITPEAIREDRAIWEEVVRKVRDREMPPARFPQLTDHQRTAIVTWVEEVLSASVETVRPIAKARRLQQNEYVNTMRDLFGVRVELPPGFPADERPWRKVSEAIEVPATLAGKYREAAESVLDRATTQSTTGGVEYRSLLASVDGAHCDMDQARTQFLAFCRRAYRRPIDADEAERLAAILENCTCAQATGEDAVRAAVLEVLTSSAFLYCTESLERSAGYRHAEQLALASRLSYFLWRSMPDEELLALAEAGKLGENVEAQTRRLLRDERSRDFVADFATHWLSLERLDAYPDIAVAGAMKQETVLFVTSILKENRHVSELLDADYTYLTEPLARHYEIADVHGTDMRRVTLHTRQRGGLLTHGSVLMAPANDAETSPVNRGKWVLESLLGSAPIRPTPEALAALAQSRTSFGAGAPRKLLEAHRANPGCADCHAKMDALGLALENFDPRGAWRTTWNGGDVEPIGVLPEGEVLNGVGDLKRYMLTHRGRFSRALAEKLLAFALNRNLGDADRDALKLDNDDPRAWRLIVNVVQSESFQMEAKVGAAKR